MSFMNVLHAHYQPPQSPQDLGGILFWVETTDASASAPKQTRVAKKPKSRLHPFCADTGILKHILYLDGASKTITLRLPAVKDVPLPSPPLIHNWNLDSKNPKLSSFLVNGIWMRPPEAISALLAFSSQTDASLSPAADTRFWSMVSALALETLAAHKLVPIIVNEGREYYARWLPILDAPKDATRLKQLEEAMPAMCRAALTHDPPSANTRDASRSPTGRGEQSPKKLLTSFLDTFCDALAREWGKSAAPKYYDDSPASSWMRALFSENARILLSSAQAQNLAASHKAWMRNLHVAGDAAFRIAFRLEAPALQQQPWQLHYLIQAKDDPSLLVPPMKCGRKPEAR
jgi:hypothetical protein